MSFHTFSFIVVVWKWARMCMRECACTLISCPPPLPTSKPNLLIKISVRVTTSTRGDCETEINECGRKHALMKSLCRGVKAWKRIITVLVTCLITGLPSVLTSSASTANSKAYVFIKPFLSSEKFWGATAYILREISLFLLKYLSGYLFDLVTIRQKNILKLGFVTSHVDFTTVQSSKESSQRRCQRVLRFYLLFKLNINNKVHIRRTKKTDGSTDQSREMPIVEREFEDNL
ncbi:hypothetical protein EGR_01497 [Echinococcus granulosus]|uniref:Uncharacterized protein n=1 Tax=Echinococcus granulosus TaxID=6210 RepID=W6VAR8_ECHGR|nr:hypothetical protein EGR_01497 [Echinococcus granulosus]EUB63874.1 hypothetical protein EGR_01497 [Echinococcus granulosus]